MVSCTTAVASWHLCSRQTSLTKQQPSFGESNTTCKIFIDRGHRLSYFCRISYHICLHSSTDFSVQISSDFSKSLWPLWYEWWVSQVHLALKINCHLSVACDKFWTILVQIMQMTMIQGRKFDKRYSPFSITSSYHKATFCVQDDAPSGRMICRGLVWLTAVYVGG